MTTAPVHVTALAQTNVQVQQMTRRNESGAATVKGKCWCKINIFAQYKCCHSYYEVFA